MCRLSKKSDVMSFILQPQSSQREEKALRATKRGSENVAHHSDSDVEIQRSRHIL